MKQTGAVDQLVTRASRRWLSNLILNQVVIAGCAGMAGVILVLLAGTDLLDWIWIAAIVAAGLIAGGWRLRRRLPSRYTVAQAIDRRLTLEDTISTAYFYSRVASGRGTASLRAPQAQRADAIAAAVSVEEAVPYHAPRSLYAMAALGLAASGLFTLRYGVSHTLDLRQPLPKIVLDVFHFTAKANPVAKKQDRRDRRMEELLKQFGLSLESNQKQGTEGQDPSSGADGEALEQSEEGQHQAAASGKSANQEGQEQQGDSDMAGLNVPQEGQEGRKTSGEQAETGLQPSEGGEQNQNGAQENNSLLSKFRDALSSLMSRLKSQPKGGNSQQMASASQGRQESQARQSQGQQGSEQGQQGETKGLPGGQGQGQQEGESSEQASEGGQSKQGGRDSQRASQEGRSGMGKEDGSKDVRQAEQLAAMGKISEIIGKRSQTLTGEVMVEVTSSSQQLKTAYSQQSATHAEAGGEIHRDEVPLAYQHYVQQYFEELRKTPAPKSGEPAPATGAKP